MVVIKEDTYFDVRSNAKFCLEKRIFMPEGKEDLLDVEFWAVMSEVLL